MKLSPPSYEKKELKRTLIFLVIILMQFLKRKRKKAVVGTWCKQGNHILVRMREKQDPYSATHDCTQPKSFGSTHITTKCGRRSWKDNKFRPLPLIPFPEVKLASQVFSCQCIRKTAVFTFSQYVSVHPWWTSQLPHLHLID